MRRPLVTWTVLMSSLVALGVWTLLGPPEHTGGSHWQPRNLTTEAR